MLFYFKNHFAMVVSTVIAMILSLCMAVTAIIWDKLEISIELIIRNWGTAFLTIMLVSALIPCKMLGDKFAAMLKLNPGTLPFGLVSNLVPTFFYNTAATLILVGVNVGFSAPYYWMIVKADYLVMFAVSYVLSLIAERIGMLVAVRACAVPAKPEI